jgi:hypothetical protein
MNLRSRKNTEPRWPSLIAMLAIGGLYAALPSSLSVAGSKWVLLVVVVGLLVPLEIAHHRHNHAMNQLLGYLLNGLVTVAIIVSVTLLTIEVAHHQIVGNELLRSAGALWSANFLIFASWYWRLDGGGPHQRALTLGHSDGAFLFPQMTMHPDAKAAAGEEEWEPNFVDYLFLAFNTSTAFSPTDVPVLSRWAKALMMVQAIISLVVIAMLAGRAVNII